MKLWIKIGICAVMVATIITLSVLCMAQRRHLNSLEMQLKQQSEVIDSLLTRKSIVFDVKLIVTDKTRTYVHGRYNTGTINVPSTKTYVLEIDSTNIRLK